MTSVTMGIVARDTTAPALLDAIEQLDRRGVPAVWLTTVGAGVDGPSVLAAAATRTERIALGSSVTPTWPRHPIVLAQQAQVIAQLAPGRLRLGIGTSSRDSIEGMFGVPFHAPLANLKEYVRVLKDLLQRGKVDLDGAHYHAHATISATYPDVPVLAATLIAKSYEAAGEAADGAISWVTPLEYIQRRGLPALRAGAARANRPAPALYAHVPVCLSTSAADVRAAVSERLGFYPQLKVWRDMFVDAGFADAAEGKWSDALTDGTVAHGDEARVAKRLQAFIDAGAREILVEVVAAGPDKDKSYDRATAFVADVAKTALAGGRLG